MRAILVVLSVLSVASCPATAVHGVTADAGTVFDRRPAS